MSTQQLIARLAVIAVAVLGSVSGGASELYTEGGRGRFGPNDPVTFGAFRQLSADVSPSVVYLRVTVSVRGGSLPGIGEARGEGTGFIINADGYAVTNNHVVEDARSITAVMLDGSEYPAELIGRDPRTDLALVRVIAPHPLPIAKLGDSSSLEVGDWVVAIGNPFGLDHSVTAGIVSALGRRDIRPEGRELYEDFIQTDASINPGNSGGPLVDINGNVVGVNTAINAHGSGIGFAIPINMVKTLLPQLMTGSVERSWLGVRSGAVPADVASVTGLVGRAGAMVFEVVSGGPADAAGVRRGDVIVAFDGEQIQEHRALPWMAATAGVGRDVPLQVLRGSTSVRLTVTMGRLPGSSGSRELTTDGPTASAFGVRVANVTPDVAMDLGVPDGAGVVVVHIEETSPAVRAGLQPHDVIVQVGDVPVASVDQFEREAGATASGEMVRFRVRRGSATVFVAFFR